MKKLNTYLFEKFKITKKVIGALDKKTIERDIFSAIYNFLDKKNIDTSSWLIYKVDSEKYITMTHEKTWYFYFEISSSELKSHNITLDDIVNKLQNEVTGIEKYSVDSNYPRNKEVIKMYLHDPE